MGSNRRTKDLGVLARVCPSCQASGTLRVKHVQDLRKVGPFRVKDREPYRMARCTACGTVLSVRTSDPLDGA